MPFLHIIAGITYPNADVQKLDLNGIVPKGTIAICINGEKKTGTGLIEYYPFGDSTKKGVRCESQKEQVTIGLDKGVLTLRLTVANDTFDITFFHTWVNRY
jgi:hypothetical protein